MIEVESAFGARLPVNLAFEAPTLQALAREVEKAKAFSADICDDYVFHLAGDGDAPPIFFAGVDLSLARRGLWTLPYSLYAVAYLAAGGGFMKEDTLEDLAASYIERIRRISPRVPTVWPVTLWVAWSPWKWRNSSGPWAMRLNCCFFWTRRCQRANRSKAAAESSTARSGLRIAAVAPGRSMLKGTVVRGRRILKGPVAEGWGPWLSFFVPLPLPLSRRLPLPLQRSLLSLTGRVNHALTNWHLRHPSALSGLLFPKERWPGIWFATKRLVRKYRPRRYDGRVFAAFADEGRRSAWQALVPQAEVEAIPLENHDVFKAPVIDQWAPRLAECLQCAPAQRGTYAAFFVANKAKI